MRKIEAFPGKLTKQRVKNGNGMNSTKIVLDEAQKEWMRKWFPKTENSKLAEASGMSHSTLHRFARKMGLTKSKSGLEAIKRRQAAHIRRVLTKNGYYDSLRGKPMSKAFREGAARIWQEIREGKRDHPLVVLRRKNPREYNRKMRQKSHERKELYRKEELRIRYGLQPKTRLRIVMCKYTRRQVAHRSSALKRGYIIMEDCSEQGGERYNIYYDNDTNRSQMFEQNLINDGFRIRQWQE